MATDTDIPELISSKKNEREDRESSSEFTEEKVTEFPDNRVKQFESRIAQALETSSDLAKTVNTKPETDIEFGRENDVAKGDIGSIEGGNFFQAFSVPMVTSDETSNIAEGYKATTTQDQASKLTEIEPLEDEKSNDDEQVEVVTPKDASAEERRPNTGDHIKESQTKEEGVVEATSAETEESDVPSLGLTQCSDKDIGEVKDFCNEDESTGGSTNTKTEAVYGEDLQGKNYHSEGKEPGYVKTIEGMVEDTEEIKKSDEKEEKKEQTESQKENTRNEEKNIGSSDGRKEKSDSSSVKEACEETSSEKVESEGEKPNSSGIKLNEETTVVISKDEDQVKEQEITMRENSQGGDDVTSSHDAALEDLKETATRQDATIVACFEEQGLFERPQEILKEETEDKKIDVQDIDKKGSPVKANEQSENGAKKDKKEQKLQESVDRTVLSSETEQEVEENFKRDETDAGEEARITETESSYQDFEVKYQVEDTETEHSKDELKQKDEDTQDDRGSSEGTPTKESEAFSVCSKPKMSQGVSEDVILEKSEPRVTMVTVETSSNEIEEYDRMQSISSDLSSEKTGLSHVACDTGPVDVNTIAKLGEDIKSDENKDVQNPEIWKNGEGKAGDETECETQDGTQNTSSENKDEALGEIPQSHILEDSSTPLLKSCIQVPTEVIESTGGILQDVEVSYDQAGYRLAKETDDETFDKKEDRCMDLETHMQKGNVNKDIDEEHFYATSVQEKSIDASDVVHIRNSEIGEAIHHNVTGEQETQVEKGQEVDTSTHKSGYYGSEGPCITKKEILEVVEEKFTEQDFQESQSETNKETEIIVEAENHTNRKEEKNPTKDDIISTEEISTELTQTKEQNVEEVKACLTKTVSEEVDDEITKKGEDLSRHNLEYMNDNCTTGEKCFPDDRTREMEISKLELEPVESEHYGDQVPNKNSTHQKERIDIEHQGEVMHSSSLETSTEDVSDLGNLKTESDSSHKEDFESVSDVKIFGEVLMTEDSKVNEECLISATTEHTDDNLDRENEHLTGEISNEGVREKDKKTKQATEIEKIAEHPSLVSLDANLIEEELGTSSGKENITDESVEDPHQDSIAEREFSERSELEEKEENDKQEPTKIDEMKWSDTNREVEVLIDQLEHNESEQNVGADQIPSENSTDLKDTIEVEPQGDVMHSRSLQTSTEYTSNVEESKTEYSILHIEDFEPVPDVQIPGEVVKSDDATVTEEGLISATSELKDDNLDGENEPISREISNEEKTKQATGIEQTAEHPLIGAPDAIPIEEELGTSSGKENIIDESVEDPYQDSIAEREISERSGQETKEENAKEEPTKIDEMTWSDTNKEVASTNQNVGVDQLPNENSTELKDTIEVETQGDGLHSKSLQTSTEEASDLEESKTVRDSLGLEDFESISDVKIPEELLKTEDAKVNEECLISATAEHTDDNLDGKNKPMTREISNEEKTKQATEIEQIVKQPSIGAPEAILIEKELGKYSGKENITDESVEDTYQDSIAEREVSEKNGQETKEENAKEEPSKIDQKISSDTIREVEALADQNVGVDQVPNENSTIPKNTMDLEPQANAMHSRSLQTSTEDASNIEESKTESGSLPKEDLESVLDVKIPSEVLISEDTKVNEECITSATDEHLDDILYGANEPITREIAYQEKTKQETEIEQIAEQPSIRTVDAILIEEELGTCCGEENIIDESIEDPHQDSIEEREISEGSGQETKEENAKEEPTKIVEMSDTNREVEVSTDQNVDAEQVQNENSTDLKGTTELEPQRNVMHSRSPETSTKETPNLEEPKIESGSSPIEDFESVSDVKIPGEVLLSEDAKVNEECLTSTINEHQDDNLDGENQLITRELSNEEATEIEKIVEHPSMGDPDAILIEEELGTSSGKENIADKSAEEPYQDSIAELEISERNGQETKEENAKIEHTNINEMMWSGKNREVEALIDQNVDEDQVPNENSTNLNETTEVDAQGDAMHSSSVETSTEDTLDLEKSKIEIGNLPIEDFESVSDVKVPGEVLMSENAKVNEECLISAIAEHKDDNLDGENEPITREIANEEETKQATEIDQTAEQPSIGDPNSTIIEEELGTSSGKENITYESVDNPYQDSNAEREISERSGQETKEGNAKEEPTKIDEMTWSDTNKEVEVSTHQNVGVDHVPNENSTYLKDTTEVESQGDVMHPRSLQTSTKGASNLKEPKTESDSLGKEDFNSVTDVHIPGEKLKSEDAKVKEEDFISATAEHMHDNRDGENEPITREISNEEKTKQATEIEQIAKQHLIGALDTILIEEELGTSSGKENIMDESVDDPYKDSTAESEISERSGQERKEEKAIEEPTKIDEKAWSNTNREVEALSDQKAGVDQVPSENSTDLKDTIDIEPQGDVMHSRSLQTSTEDASNIEESKTESGSISIEDFEPVSDVKITGQLFMSEDAKVNEECLTSAIDEHLVDNKDGEKEPITREIANEEATEIEQTAEHPLIGVLDAIIVEEEFGTSDGKENITDESVEDPCKDPIAEREINERSGQETKDENVKEEHVNIHEMTWTDTNREVEALIDQNVGVHHVPKENSTNLKETTEVDPQEDAMHSSSLETSTEDVLHLEKSKTASRNLAIEDFESVSDVKIPGEVLLSEDAKVNEECLTSATAEHTDDNLDGEHEPITREVANEEETKQATEIEQTAEHTSRGVPNSNLIEEELKTSNGTENITYESVQDPYQDSVAEREIIERSGQETKEENAKEDPSKIDPMTWSDTNKEVEASTHQNVGVEPYENFTDLTDTIEAEPQGDVMHSRSHQTSTEDASNLEESKTESDSLGKDLESASDVQIPEEKLKSEDAKVNEEGLISATAEHTDDNPDGENEPITREISNEKGTEIEQTAEHHLIGGPDAILNEEELGTSSGKENITDESVDGPYKDSIAEREISEKSGQETKDEKAREEPTKIDKMMWSDTNREVEALSDQKIGVDQVPNGNSTELKDTTDVEPQGDVMHARSLQTSTEDASNIEESKTESVILPTEDLESVSDVKIPSEVLMSEHAKVNEEYLTSATDEYSVDNQDGQKEPITREIANEEATQTEQTAEHPLIGVPDAVLIEEELGTSSGKENITDESVEDPYNDPTAEREFIKRSGQGTKEENAKEEPTKIDKMTCTDTNREVEALIDQNVGVHHVPKENSTNLKETTDVDLQGDAMHLSSLETSTEGAIKLEKSKTESGNLPTEGFESVSDVKIPGEVLMSEVAQVNEECLISATAENTDDNLNGENEPITGEIAIEEETEIKYTAEHPSIGAPNSILTEEELGTSNGKENITYESVEYPYQDSIAEREISERSGQETKEENAKEPTKIDKTAWSDTNKEVEASTHQNVGVDQVPNDNSTDLTDIKEAEPQGDVMHSRSLLTTTEDSSHLEESKTESDSLGREDFEFISDVQIPEEKLKSEDATVNEEGLISGTAKHTDDKQDRENEPIISNVERTKQATEMEQIVEHHLIGAPDAILIEEELGTSCGKENITDESIDNPYKDSIAEKEISERSGQETKEEKAREEPTKIDEMTWSDTNTEVEALSNQNVCVDQVPNQNSTDLKDTIEVEPQGDVMHSSSRQIAIKETLNLQTSETERGGLPIEGLESVSEVKIPGEMLKPEDTKVNEDCLISTTDEHSNDNLYGENELISREISNKEATEIEQIAEHSSIGSPDATHIEEELGTSSGKENITDESIEDHYQESIAERETSERNGQQTIEENVNEEPTKFNDMTWSDTNREDDALTDQNVGVDQVPSENSTNLKETTEVEPQGDVMHSSSEDASKLEKSKPESDSLHKEDTESVSGVKISGELLLSEDAKVNVECLITATTEHTVDNLDGKNELITRDISNEEKTKEATEIEQIAEQPSRDSPDAFLIEEEHGTPSIKENITDGFVENPYQDSIAKREISERSGQETKEEKAKEEPTKSDEMTWSDINREVEALTDQNVGVDRVPNENSTDLEETTEVEPQGEDVEYPGDILMSEDAKVNEECLISATAEHTDDNPDGKDEPVTREISTEGKTKQATEIEQVAEQPLIGSADAILIEKELATSSGKENITDESVEDPYQDSIAERENSERSGKESKEENANEEPTNVDKIKWSVTNREVEALTDQIVAANQVSNNNSTDLKETTEVEREGECMHSSTLETSTEDASKTESDSLPREELESVSDVKIPGEVLMSEDSKVNEECLTSATAEHKEENLDGENEFITREISNEEKTNQATEIEQIAEHPSVVSRDTILIEEELGKSRGKENITDESVEDPYQDSIAKVSAKKQVPLPPTENSENKSNKIDESIEYENRQNTVSDKEKQEDAEIAKKAKGVSNEDHTRDDEPSDLPLTRQRSMEFDAPVTHGTAATEALEISRKYVTDDVMKVGKISPQIQKQEMSSCIVDEQLPNIPCLNESTKGKLLTGNIDVSNEHGESTVKSLNAEAEDLKAASAQGTKTQCSSKNFEEDNTMSNEKENSAAAQPAKILIADMLHESTKGPSQVAEKLIEEREPTQKKDQQVDREETGDSKVIIDDEQEDEEDNQKMEAYSDTPITVEASKDMEVKVHKKSHNILSGVGSKVKHSIAKVKKAITGKSSHSKPPSLKQKDEVIT